MAGHSPGTTLKATCVKAEGNDLQFVADAEDVKYFQAGVGYVLHATRLPDGGDDSGAARGAAKSPRAKT
jgi:hypothetical protein